ncbi:MAG TPA: Bax inhibitor-1/YccA family protein [Prolixibacteraceae bacterium]|nr:Bax inhibitor-1/YccA family protein [Prolixibacteraceae bacterium]
MINKTFNLSPEEIIAETQRFFVKVYGWMSLALIVTGYVAIWTASHVDLVSILNENKGFFIGLLVLEFVLVAYLVGWIMKMSSHTATLIFLLYSVLNGFTFSILFLIYTAESIATTFFVTAGTFAIMSIYGYFTKTDLTQWGSLLFMGLIGLIIASAVNLYFHNNAIYWITTYAGIFIFTGLIAYDTQKIKELNIVGNEGTDDDKKEAIIGALTLYLDFINLFLKLLRLFGKRK